MNMDMHAPMHKYICGESERESFDNNWRNVKKKKSLKKEKA